MLSTNNTIEINPKSIETLESFISKDEEYTISNNALFIGFQHRTKVEFLRFFIV